MSRLTIAQAIGTLADTAQLLRPSPRGLSPVVDPRLRVAYIPALHHRAPTPWEARPGPFHGHRTGAGPAEASAEALGLSAVRNSETDGAPPRRNGLKGLTALGRKRLQSGCCLLEEQRHLLSFWTITLPDQFLAHICEADSWPRFQEAIRHRLNHALVAQGLDPMVLAVVELHPERSVRAGQALPHLHVLFQGKRRTGGTWVLAPRQLDGIICAALAAVGIDVEAVPGAGQVERIRRSVRRYMAKYLSKTPRQLVDGRGDAAVGDPRLCPRQWWFMSKPLQLAIMKCTRSMPADFLSWLIDRRKPPAPGQSYAVQRAALTNPSAPNVWMVTFRSPWGLWLAWESWEQAHVSRRPRPPTMTGETNLVRQ